MKRAFLIRFTIIHLLTYWVIGGIMYELCGYEEALAHMEYFQLWRDLENLTSVALVFFGQIFRGVILGLLLYPFAPLYLDRKRGFLLLFLLLFGLTSLASPLFLIDSLTYEHSLAQWISDMVIGLPELVVQTFVFSVILVGWMNGYKKKVSKD